MSICGRRYDTGELVQLDVAEGKIARVSPAARDQAKQDWPWIAPGLIDLQVNGYGGQEFSSAELTLERVLSIGRTMLSFGVTSYCPTLTTESLDVLQHGLQTIHAACESSPDAARQIIGIHLEGPYLSSEDGPRGAHPPRHCRRPDWDEFQRLQESAGGRIRLHTMAVEFDEAPAFIERLVASGVAAAIGHTAADSEQIDRAVDAGAKLSTHLGNGSHPTIHRHRNYIWDQLAEDRLMASLIADGHHLPPVLVKTIVRAKAPERCILVSDLSGQAGQPPGRYRSKFCDVDILPGGRLVVAGQRELMAGASVPINVGLANLMAFAGVDLKTAFHMAVHHPARLLDVDPGGLEPGDLADLVLFDLIDHAKPDGLRKLEPRATFAHGRIAWGS
jgi:N-acetylglucosamine-6-phosphate deacetylase